MRLKVVLIILFVASAILGTSLVFFKPDRSASSISKSVIMPAVQPATNPLPAKIIFAPTPVVVSKPPVVTNAQNSIPATNHDRFVQERNAELMALAMNNDAVSFNTIWSELSNPDREIRAGALAAVVQFGDRSVSPRLRDLAAKIDDAEEKVAILDAANFLELPSLTELHRASPTNAPQ